jgi:hypothetical protein
LARPFQPNLENPGETIMPVKAISISPEAEAPCRGFTLEVKVFIPKKGFRFHVIVDKTCVNNEPRWGVMFELEKLIDNKFAQVVFVEYKPKLDDTEAVKGIEKMLETKVTQEQLKIAKAELAPVAMELEGADTITPDQKKRLETAARKFVIG